MIRVGLVFVFVFVFGVFFVIFGLELSLSLVFFLVVMEISMFMVLVCFGLVSSSSVLFVSVCKSAGVVVFLIFFINFYCCWLIRSVSVDSAGLIVFAVVCCIVFEWFFSVVISVSLLMFWLSISVSVVGWVCFLSVLVMFLFVVLCVFVFEWVMVWIVVFWIRVFEFVVDSSMMRMSLVSLGCFSLVVVVDCTFVSVLMSYVMMFLVFFGWSCSLWMVVSRIFLWSEDAVLCSIGSAFGSMLLSVSVVVFVSCWVLVITVVESRESAGAYWVRFSAMVVVVCTVLLGSFSFVSSIFLLLFGLVCANVNSVVWWIFGIGFLEWLCSVEV